MCDLGPLFYFLRSEVSCLSNGFSISREKYIHDILACTALGDERTVETPMELNVHRRASDGYLLSDPMRYRYLVGRLVYLVIIHLDFMSIFQVSSLAHPGPL
jgi:hypothetical protein